MNVTQPDMQYNFKDSTEYLGNFVLTNGKLDKYLFAGGYLTASESGAVFHYYTPDHLGNSRAVIKQDGTIEQVTHYYPFGGIISDLSTNPNVQQYKYNGKEYERMHGLNWYDYGARHYDAAIGSWPTMDPLAEKYYHLSPYNYCGNNPIKFVDPDGRDWYKDKDGTYQYDPNINRDSQLAKNQLYIGKAFRQDGAWYRKDGSILFNNETAAYNRMWNQADKHYRAKDSRGREVGGFILKDGKVLVLPDYANDYNTTKIGEYGYQIHEDGSVSHGNEVFSALAQIHTHQKGAGDPTPSFYAINGKHDGKVSMLMGGRPVFTMGHDGKIYGIVENRNIQSQPFVLPSPFGSLNYILNGRKSFSNYIKHGNWELP